MPAKRDEDLFQDTTMTFGEHLEELRVSLFKAVLGLAIGVAIGFSVGRWMVELIEKPLSEALGVFYEDKSIDDFTKFAAERKTAGENVYYSTVEVAHLVKNEHLVLEIRYVHPQQALSELERSEPKAFHDKKLAAAANGPNQAEMLDVLIDGKPEKVRAVTARARLMPLFHWYSVEEDPRTNPTTLSAQEAFSIWMKASFVVGVILSSPWVFYQIWSFVAAGLYPHEKKYVYRFLPMSLGLFLAGAALAYLFVFQPVLNFLFGFNRWLGFDPEPRISEWLSFVLFLPLGFGVSFQLPLVMLFLERIGVFSLKAYIEKWRIAVLVIFILSAVLTPADPYSIFLMAVPLTILYFGGMLLCLWMPRAAAE